MEIVSRQHVASKQRLHEIPGEGGWKFETQYEAWFPWLIRDILILLEKTVFYQHVTKGVRYTS